ncbi:MULTISPECIES: biopolymer transporter ExbD [Thioclava]|uniref:Biopolymer transporter ExbD n=1 Tax=Thioclava litoralis TaxID=3076557 RepID=A0ABZ1E310_9RHOB|nr:biopolymer transporter ExbD [Thioclava sp. FTW29]
MCAARPLLPPPPRRTRRVALTPLADTMFQLLIFFMLSSGLTPYSLLGLSGASGAGGQTMTASGTGQGGAQPARGRDQDQQLWRIGAGDVETNGQHFPFAQIDALAQALAQQEPVPDVVLVARAEAHVQDVVTVMARLHAQGLQNVRLAIDAEGGR